MIRKTAFLSSSPSSSSILAFSIMVLSFISWSAISSGPIKVRMFTLRENRGRKQGTKQGPDVTFLNTVWHSGKVTSGPCFEFSLFVMFYISFRLHFSVNLFQDETEAMQLPE